MVYVSKDFSIVALSVTSLTEMVQIQSTSYMPIRVHYFSVTFSGPIVPNHLQISTHFHMTHHDSNLCLMTADSQILIFLFLMVQKKLLLTKELLTIGFPIHSIYHGPNLSLKLFSINHIAYHGRNVTMESTSYSVYDCKYQHITRQIINKVVSHHCSPFAIFSQSYIHSHNSNTSLLFRRLTQSSMYGFSLSWSIMASPNKKQKKRI